MPCDYRRYHPDWKSIRRQILDQANHRCEFCGVPNKSWIVRDRNGNWTVDKTLGDCDAVIVWGMPSRRGPTRVVLTVAHLCHDTTCWDPTHLRALCQKCHLRYDQKHHMSNATKTRLRKKREAIAATGQLVML